jgi:hypothetical protein
MRSSVRSASWVFASTLVGLAAAGPASAETDTSRAGDMAYVTQTKPLAAGDVRVLRPACPQGTRLTAGGGSLEGKRLRAADVHSALLPVDTGRDDDTERDDAFRSTALNPTKANATSSATAVCMGGDAAGQLSYSVDQETYSQNISFGFETACSAGSLIGGGAGWDGRPTESQFGFGRPSLDSSRPFANSWAASGSTDQELGPRTFTWVASCLSPEAGTIETRTVESDSPDFAGTLKVQCSPGFRVTAGGGSGKPVRESLPFDDGDRGEAPDDGWKVSALPNPNGNTLRLTALCVGRPVAR